MPGTMPSMPPSCDTRENACQEKGTSGWSFLNACQACGASTSVPVMAGSRAMKREISANTSQLSFAHVRSDASDTLKRPINNTTARGMARRRPGSRTIGCSVTVGGLSEAGAASSGGSGSSGSPLCAWLSSVVRKASYPFRSRVCSSGSVCMPCPWSCMMADRASASPSPSKKRSRHSSNAPYTASSVMEGGHAPFLQRASVERETHNLSASQRTVISLLNPRMTMVNVWASSWHMV